MLGLQELVQTVKKFEHVLNDRALEYYNAIGSTRDDIKDWKLTFNILHETICEHEGKQNAAASSVILSCVHFLISNWDDDIGRSHRSILQKLPSLLNASLRRICLVDEDMTVLSEIGWDVLKYLIIFQKGQDDGVAKCFLCGAHQLMKKDTPCSCCSSSSCTLIVAYIVEFQTLFVKFSPHKASNISVRGLLLTSFGRHCHTKKLSERHVTCIVEQSFDVLDKVSPMLPSSINCDATLRKIITHAIHFGGHASLHLESAYADLEELSATLETICRPIDSKGIPPDGIYATLFDYSLTILTRNLKFCQSFVIEALSFLKKLCGILSYSALSNYQLLGLASFIRNTCSGQSLGISIQIYHEILRKSNMMSGFPEDDDGLKFLASIYSVGVIAVNGKANKKSYELTERFFQNLLTMLSRKLFSENSKCGPTVTNIGVTIVKNHRKYENYLQAMNAAETTIRMLPYDSSMHLVDQWVKAKCGIEENAHGKTLATNLKGDVPQDFLIKTLMRELEMYVQMGMGASSICAVTTALLDHDRTLIDEEISHIMRHHIKAKFEIGDQIDFDELLGSHGDAKLLFEDILEIKLVQFLQKWHAAFDNADCQNTKFDITELFVISTHLKKAKDADCKLKHISETCTAVHKAYAITCIFGQYRLALEIIGALYLLLTHQDVSSDTKHIIKMNICSTCCEMSACYIFFNQITAAQKYADQAVVEWDLYKKCVDNSVSGDKAKDRASKRLYYKVQATRIEILYLLHKNDEAKSLLKRCFEDDYLDIENIKTSVHALHCSCVVSMARYTESDPVELRMINLLDLFKRLSSLRMTVLPQLHSKTQRFGCGLENVSFGLYMQLSCLSLVLRCLRYISKTYFLLGDSALAKTYILSGSTYAKSLHLKNWYLRFSLLKLELSSMGDYTQYSEVVEGFIETAKCNCQKEKSWISINDGTLGDDNEDFEISIDEDETDNAVVGSSEADAILIPTKKIKMLDNQYYDNDVASSPKVKTRVISKKSKVLSFLSENACFCADFSAVECSALRLELGVIHANYCLRNHNYNEALNICNFCLGAIAEADEITMQIDVNSICKAQFWWKVKVELMLAKAGILSATEIKAQAMAECESVKNLISESDVIQHTSSILKAKLHIVLANISTEQEKSTDDVTCDIKELNSFIDALSKPYEISSDVTLPTPKLSRRRKIVSAKNSSNTKTKTVRTQCKKSAVTEQKENFSIYEDNQHNALPVPQFQIGRSPSPIAENVYDFDIPDCQNIRLTRKAARTRFKNKYGTTYTEEAKEKIRGRTTTKKSTAIKTRSRAAKSSTCKDLVSVDIKVDYTSNLEEALVNASSVGDFILMKISAQALSRSHFRSYQTNGDNFQYTLAATYHALSIGITTRSALSIYVAKIRQQLSVNSRDASINKPNDLPGDLFKSLVKKETSLLCELQDLLPEKWTVCAISVTEPTDSEPMILITRVRKHEIYHNQVRANSFFEILGKFHELMNRNIEALKSCDRSYWWQHRRILDNDLKSLISSLPSEALGQYVGLLLGYPIVNGAYELEISKLFKQFPALKKNPGQLCVALDSWYHLKIQQKLSTVKGLMGEDSDYESMITLTRALEKASTSLQLHAVERGHVVLIPGKHVQMLPWESTPLLQKSSVTRMPSVDLVKHHLTKLKTSEDSVLNEGVDMNDVSYVLNPNGDLKKSEQRIQEKFQHMKNWKGIVARVPDSKEWICSITDYDLFIYCGHGSGDRYISGRDLQKVKTRAAAMLMGCNSAKLYQDGLFEPNGIVLNYLISGAPCVIGCLWKVTDKDIDNYLCNLLEKWADGKESPVSLSAISAKEEMKMPYINGAACVIYGLPIHCQSSTANVLNALPET